MWGGNRECEVSTEWVLLRTGREKKIIGCCAEFELVDHLKTNPLSICICGCELKMLFLKSSAYS